MAEQQIASVQQSINHRIELLETLNKSLKQEAGRALTTLARYKSQNLNDGVFSRANIKDSNFKELEEYNNLISKQFCARLEQLRTSLLALKIEMDRIAKKLKSKPEPNDYQSLSGINARLKQFQGKFTAIWQEQHFLLLNYKLDCAAKELQRWTAVSQSLKKTPQSITSMVNSMFS